MLVDVEPHLDALLLGVGQHAGHVDFGSGLRSVADERGDGQVPLPADEQVRDVVLHAEVDVPDAAVGSQRHAAHALAGLHPVSSIGNLARLVQVVDDVAVLQEFTVGLARQNHLPGRGGVGHHIHGRVHHRLQGVAPGLRGDIGLHTPVVAVGIAQCGTHTTRQGDGHYALDGLLDVVHVLQFVGRLRPLGTPHLCTLSKGVVGQVAHHLVIDRHRVLGQEIAERYALVVGPHLDVQAVVALILLGEVNRAGIVVVGLVAPLAIERVQHLAVLAVSDGVNREALHPRVVLRVVLRQCVLPLFVVHLQPQPRGRDNLLSVAHDAVLHAVARLPDLNPVHSLRRGHHQLLVSSLAHSGRHQQRTH